MLVLVAQADPPDVAVHGIVVARAEFEPAEGESLVDLAELADAVFVDAGEGVPLRTVLVRSARVRAAHVFELALRLIPKLVETTVERADIAALALQLVRHSTASRDQNRTVYSTFIAVALLCHRRHGGTLVARQLIAQKSRRQCPATGR